LLQLLLQLYTVPYPNIDQELLDIGIEIIKEINDFEEEQIL
jgi:hypothetical protein